jgi:hypothetical protein
MYLILSISCVHCNKCVVKLTSEHPLEETKRDVEAEAGNMSCLHTRVVELVPDGAVRELEVNNDV